MLWEIKIQRHVELSTGKINHKKILKYILNILKFVEFISFTQFSIISSEDCIKTMDKNNNRQDWIPTKYT